MGLLTFLGLASVTKEIIKEKTEPTIPSENWKNAAKTWDVFNLDTKGKYWNKPTYKSITQCIKYMRDYCIKYNIHYLAMPKIGCGLDKLQWGKVREIIKEEFKDVDIQIEIRYL